MGSKRRIAAILGSPRAGGNTDILASKVIEGAREVGFDAVTISLRSLKVKPCTACEKCWNNAKPCVIKDDMASVYETIASSDVLLFATPVYWYAPTALMKALIDRLVPFNRPQGRPLIKAKKALLIVAYEEEGPAAAEPLIRMFEMSFGYLELQFAGRVIVDGVGPKGAVLQKPEALQQAYELGRQLAEPSDQ